MTTLLGDYTFQVVAAGTMLLGLAGGVTGTFAVLRRQSLVGDGLSHASLPGVVAAFLLTGTKKLEWLLLGAALFAVAALAWTVALSRFTKVKFDAALATSLASFFGLGMVLLTYLQTTNDSQQAGLSKFIFGQAATMVARDVYVTAALAVTVLVLAMLFWKELKIMAFDADFARSLHISAGGVNLIYGAMLILTIVSGLQSVGAVLMSSLLIAPAVAARQWTDRLGVMAALAGIIGALSCLVGTMWSASLAKMPTGPAIVIVVSAVTLVSILVAPRRGIFARRQRLRRQRLMWRGGGNDDGAC